MPKDPKLKSLLIIGSGPIVTVRHVNLTIQVTCLRSLREDGIETILMTNPATIMTDP